MFHAEPAVGNAAISDELIQMPLVVPDWENALEANSHRTKEKVFKTLNDLVHLKSSSSLALQGGWEFQDGLVQFVGLAKKDVKRN